MEDRLKAIEAYQTKLQAMGRLSPVVIEALDKARDIIGGHQLIFYVAGALTGIDEPTKERYARLSDCIADSGDEAVAMFGYAPHLHGTDPVRHPDVTPEEVRDIDYLFAAIVPDYHINLLAPLAHGNAIEEGWAEAAGVPSIYMAPSDMRLSRLVLGMHNIHAIVRYDEFGDGLQEVRQLLATLTLKLTSVKQV